MKKFLITILSLLAGVQAFAQDPQTNDPKVFYPLLDDYIKQGYDRNHRAHTRNLRTIDYVYVQSISYIHDRNFHFIEFGTTDTFKVYRYWHYGYKEYRFTIAFNVAWRNNHIVMRRMFYKAMGYTYGMGECHKNCDHIMSGRTLMDNHLFFYDLVPEHWEEQLNYFYKEVALKSKKSKKLYEK